MDRDGDRDSNWELRSSNRLHRQTEKKTTTNAKTVNSLSWCRCSLEENSANNLSYTYLFRFLVLQANAY